MEQIGYVYMLECSNGKYYTGSTIDIDQRLAQHQEGLGSNFTRKYLPFKLVYVETFERIDWAFNREKQIQGWSHKKKALIESDFNSLHNLSECQNQSHATRAIIAEEVVSTNETTTAEVVSTNAQRPTD